MARIAFISSKPQAHIIQSAVISEGLRLTFGLASRTPRCAHEPLQYGSYVIPPLTPVSQITYFIHTNPSIFPDPHSFRPERWLHDPDSSNQRLDHYLTSFSRGTRNCVGINLAYAELFLTLAGVLRRFDLALAGTQPEDVRMDRDAFVPAPKEASKGVKIFVRGEIS